MPESAKIVGHLVGSIVLFVGLVTAVFGIYRLLTTREPEHVRMARHWRAD